MGEEGGPEQDYARSLPLEEAMRPDVLLAYEMNGQPLLPQHGFPLRLIVPGRYGMTHVKWLRAIEVLAEPFGGVQNAERYRLSRDKGPDEGGEGEPLTRINPRSLLEPPGFPEFATRTRIVAPGPVTLRGRAWSGWVPIERVEVSTDDGSTWAAADLGSQAGPFAWRGWTFPWDAPPGEHVLLSRAADATGQVQPAEPEWNVMGYGNNAPHRVPVLVR